MRIVVAGGAGAMAVGCSSAPIHNDYGGDREGTPSHN